MPTSFTNKLLQLFLNIGQTIEIKKGDLLLKEGATDKHLYYVQSGLLRVVYLYDGVEQIIRFGYKDSIINSLASFLNNTPSDFFIDAIRKTTLLAISKQDLLNLVQENQENQNQYITLLENLVTQQMEREIDLLTTSPADRLHRVLLRSPNLFQEVPLKYIASYLRMKPETLSRIRKS
jgi:CRP/FNR family transcriptional regulator, anaerobic regulatory protein